MQRKFRKLFSPRLVVAAILLAGAGVIALWHESDLTTARAADAPATAPASKPVMTGHLEYQQYEAWHREAMVDAFKRLGKKKDAKVDQEAVAYLEQMARYLAAEEVDVFYRPAATPQLPNLLRPGEALLAAGCDDPLVLFCHATVVGRTSRLTEARPFLKRCVAGLKQYAYADRWAAMALNDLAVVIDDRKETPLIFKARWERLTAAISGELSPAGRRLALHLALRVTKNGELASNLTADKADAADPDPWVRSVLTGAEEIHLAWEARGSGFAETVTPEEWQEFHKHLGLARNALTRAWKLAPDLPEAPAKMIAVAMGDGKNLNEKAQDWFERALTAQVDFIPAYTSMYLSLLPRWGGSYEEMLQLGQACIIKPRYDTLVPWQYALAVAAVGADSGQSWTLLRDPKIYESMSRTLDGYVAHPAAAVRRDYFGTARAAMELRAGKLQGSRKALDALTASGGHPDPAAFTYFGAPSGREAIGMVYALTGPHAVAIADAEKHLRTDGDGDIKAALAEWRTVQAMVAVDDPDAPYIDSRIAELDRSVRFAAGEWVPMQLSDTLKDWQPNEATWKLGADGRLTAKNEEGWGFKSLLWRGRQLGLDPGRAFEVAVKVEWPDERKMPGQRGGGGIVVLSMENGRRGFVELDLNNNKLHIEFPPDGKRNDDVAVNEGSEILVRCEDSVLTVFVDGQKVGEPYSVPEQYRNQMAIGLGGSFGSYIQVVSPRIRKLVPKG